MAPRHVGGAFIIVRPPQDTDIPLSPRRYHVITKYRFEENSETSIFGGSQHFLTSIKKPNNLHMILVELSELQVHVRRLQDQVSPSLLFPYTTFLLEKSYSWKQRGVSSDLSSAVITKDIVLSVVIDISEPNHPAYCFLNLSYDALCTDNAMTGAIPLPASYFASTQSRRLPYPHDNEAFEWLEGEKVIGRDILERVESPPFSAVFLTSESDYPHGKSSAAPSLLPCSSDRPPSFHSSDLSTGSTKYASSPKFKGARPLWSDWRSYIACSLGFMILAANIAVIVVVSKTIKLGRSIVNTPSIIDDHDIILAINLSAKVLETAATLLGGWTISQLWSRRVISSVGATLAGLHSLGLFGSFNILIYTFYHLWKRLFRPQMLFYVFLCLTAVVLQIYSTALVTLAIPTLVPITDPPTTFSYVDVPFMSNPGIGLSCGDGGFDKDRADACLGNMLVGNALNDIIYYDPMKKPIGGYFANPYWIDVTTQYPAIGMLLGNPIGPMNGVDMTSGSILFGENRGTIEGLIGYYGDPHTYIQDSTAYSIAVDTTVPALTAQCTESPGSSFTNVSILNATYTVPAPIPLLGKGHAMGQVTTDNRTMIISVRAANRTSNFHCAIKLALRPGKLSITSDSKGTKSIVNEVPWYWGDLHPWFDRFEIDIAPFARLWLLGMGWSDVPAINAMSNYLGTSNLYVGTGRLDNVGLPQNPYIEHYMLTMLASGVSLGFGQERMMDATPSSKISTRAYQLTKTQYFIGLRSPSQFALIFVIFWVSAFISWCMVVISQGDKWLPDWSDPANLMCTAVSSPPVSSFSGSSHGDVEPEAWKECVVLSEYEGHLVFTSKAQDPSSVQSKSQREFTESPPVQRVGVGISESETVPLMDIRREQQSV